ncbi:MAG: NAD-dependent epimerase/dehydratase family protein, partial [Bacteroidales bacterium]|nr:NAD-dependent epimerase/dehydratase family protein [Bacteroidales bacterium]
LGEGPFQLLDVLDEKSLSHFIIRHKITQIYHLAAVLSVNSEKIPVQAWKINMESLMNILEIARMSEYVKKVFWPSSIAVFGRTTPKINTPQLTIMEPNTVYGITKIAGERWCEYYYHKYKMDIRSLRFPGLISYKTEPGGGTSDYAIEIFYEAIKKKFYDCYLKKDTRLPMMYMEDAINATINLMDAPVKNLSVLTGYNISGLNFTPAELADEIKKHLPDFKIFYKPDFRQEIADSWPKTIDDSAARNDWKFDTKYDLELIVKTMVEEISKKITKAG